MKGKYFLIFGVFVLVMLSVFVAAVPSWKTVGCPIDSDTDIVFYGENGFGGVGDLSESWLVHFLDWWVEQDSSISYVELSADDVQENCNFEDFPDLKVYVQPGGNAYYQQRKLGSEGKAALIDYVNSGKGYVGICAGFYYTAADYFWQDDFYDHADLLGLYPTVEGSVREIADYEGNPEYAVTALSNGFNALYYGGPTRGYEYTSAEFPGESVADFASFGTGLPAVIKDGNMLLNSVHLEAFEDDGFSGLSSEDRIENYKLLANLINEVSGTNFVVPAYANPPVCGNDVAEFGEVCDGFDLSGESCSSLGFDDGVVSCNVNCDGFDVSSCVVYPKQCSDGIDNDGDGFVDYPADLGCSSLDDDDETDIVGPVEILFDDFEDGNLDGWLLSGTGVSWDASMDVSADGTWSARAKKTGVSADSFMGKAFDVSGYSLVTFEYSRRLVGLDAADDFEVEYFDGVWNSLEHLGDARENNADFVEKSFVLPSSASGIRFKCECGAVSEKCYVDNVRVVAE